MFPPCQRVPIRDALAYAGPGPYLNVPSPTDPLSPAQRTLFPIHNTAAPSPIYRPHPRRDVSRFFYPGDHSTDLPMQRSLNYTLGPDVIPTFSHASDPPFVPTSHTNDISITRVARNTFPSPFHAQHEAPGSFQVQHSASQQSPLPSFSSLGLPRIPRAHSNPSLTSSFGAALISHVESPAYQEDQVPDAEAFLREQFGIPPNVAVNLDALPDPPPGMRPNYTNSQLARLAIYGHPRHRATLDQLLKAIENRFEWYRKENKSWRVRLLQFFPPFTTKLCTIG